MEIFGDTATVYRDFATEAYGSACFREWALGVAGDPHVLAWLQTLPERKRQANLVFAAARWHGVPAPGPYAGLRAALLADDGPIRTTILERATQTNEVGRLATLYPALAGLGTRPLALLEVGASAGLCLYPDRYSYRYGGGEDLDPREGTSTVVLHSAVIGVPPLRMPDVVWRAGIDLAPLDAADADDRRFLLSLVWPGEDGRAARIDAALHIAAADPPLLVRGDAAERGALAELAALAPRNATLVITTPGVLPHIARAGRERLGESIASLDAVWISIDPPGLHVQGAAPVDPATWGGFVLRRDGVPLAAVDPLGAFVEWRGGRANDAR